MYIDIPTALEAYKQYKKGIIFNKFNNFSKYIFCFHCLKPLDLLMVILLYSCSVCTINCKNTAQSNVSVRNINELWVYCEFFSSKFTVSFQLFNSNHIVE